MTNDTSAEITADAMTPGSIRRLLIRAMAGGAGIQAAGMLFGFLVGVQLARMLGVDSYGAYGLIMSVVAMSTVIVEFGLPHLLVREVGRLHVKNRWADILALMRWAQIVVLALATLIFLCVVFVTLVLGDRIEADFRFALYIGLLLPPVVALISLDQAALRGLGNVVLGQLADALIRPLTMSFVLLLAFLAGVGLSAERALLLGFLSAVFSWVMARWLFVVRRDASQGIGQIGKRSMRWAGDATPMMFSETIRVFQGNAAILVMGVLSNASAIGVFKVASSIFLFVSVPVTLANIVGAPFVSRLRAQGNERDLRKMLTTLSVVVTLIVFVLSLPFFLYGYQVIVLVFGEGYESAVLPLTILCVAALINASFGINATILNMIGHPGVVVRGSLWSAALLTVIAPPLVHFYGATGAAVSTTITVFVWNFYLWGSVKDLARLDGSLFGWFRDWRELRGS